MIALQAHAKINLWLRVLAREEATGYHQIETAFCALRLADDLAFENSGNGFELIVEGADLGDPDHNLVTRAAREFRDATGRETPVRVRLSKNIPVGAGLGGFVAAPASAAQTTIHIKAILAIDAITYIAFTVPLCLLLSCSPVIRSRPTSIRHKEPLRRHCAHGCRRSSDSENGPATS